MLKWTSDDCIYNHELVNKTVVFNNKYKLFAGKKAIVKSVIMINNQIAALETDKGVFSIWNFYLPGENKITNTIIYSWQAMRINHTLGYYKNRSAHCNDFSLIEEILHDLSHTENSFTITSEGGNSYSQLFILTSFPTCFSKNDDTKYICKIHFQIITNDSSYFINYYITQHKNTLEIQNSIHDPWLRTLNYMVFIVKNINIPSMVDYKLQYIVNIKKRINWSNFVRKEMIKAQNSILKCCESEIIDKNKLLSEYPYISIVITYNLPNGVIAKYVHPAPTDKYFWTDESFQIRNYGELFIHESVFNKIVQTNNLKKSGDKLPHYKYCIAHEMIHALFKEACDDSNHGEEFQKIARLVGLPMKYSQ